MGDIRHVFAGLATTRMHWPFFDWRDADGVAHRTGHVWYLGGPMDIRATFCGEVVPLDALPDSSVSVNCVACLVFDAR